MRCHVCNEVLAPDEIKYEEKYHAFAPCWVCIAAACVPFIIDLLKEKQDEYYIIDNSFDSSNNDIKDYL